MRTFFLLVAVGAYAYGLFNARHRLSSEEPLGEPPAWWFLGRPGWAMFERGSVVLSIAFGIFAVPIGLIVIFGGSDSEPWESIAIACAVGAVIGIVAGCVVGATGRPEQLVPRGLRKPN